LGRLSEGHVIEVCGGHGSDEASLGIDHGDGAPAVGDQFGGVVEIFVGIEKHGVFHNRLEFVVGSGLSKGLGIGDSEQLAIEGDDDVLVCRESRSVGDPHMRSKCSWQLHDLVDPRSGMFDDDRSVGSFGLDPGAGAEELALEPRSTGGSDDEKRSGG